MKQFAIRSMGAIALAGTFGAVLATTALAADPITILVNNSPWYGGFEAVVEKYEEETGNTVKIDRTPYPGMLEKGRNAVRADQSPYELINIDAGWVVEFYDGGFLTPLDEIDPDFSFAPEIITNGGAVFWNEEKGWTTAKGGRAMTFSPNSNTHLWYYRTDMIDTPPETYDDVLANCQALHNPPQTYGAVMRGERGNAIRFAFTPHMLAYGGSFLQDPENGDFTVTINSPENLEALKTFLQIMENCSVENPGAVAQGDLVQLLLTGKAAQAQLVVAAQSQMDDPTKSAVVGKIGYAPMPNVAERQKAGVFGGWQMGVPHNLRDSRKQAAMEFIKYFLTEDAQTYYAENGGIPVHMGVLRGPLSEQDKFRWMQPYAEVAQNASAVLLFKEGAQIEEILGLRLNQAVIGELGPEEALNLAADDAFKVLQESGRSTGKLADL
ncbi:extracellular solute-binding protein [Nitratireductor rhodophyticola]